MSQVQFWGCFNSSSGSTNAIFSFLSAVSNVTISATSTSQVQIRRFSQSENQTEVITVPVEGQNGTV